MKGAVQVTKVSPQATEKLISEFFSFSGEIDSVKLTKGPDGKQAALVIFKDAKSVETALLLTGAVIVDTAVDIEPVELPPEHNEPVSTQESGSQQPRQENQAQSMVASLLARGYILAADAHQNAKVLDEKYQGTSTARAKAQQLDEKLGLSKAAAGMNAKLKAVDDKYQISSRSSEAIRTVELKISSVGKAAMANPTVAKSVDWFRGSFKKIGDAASSLHKSATEKATEAREARKKAGAGVDEEGLPPPASTEPVAPAALLLSEAASASRQGHSSVGDRLVPQAGSSEQHGLYPEVNL